MEANNSTPASFNARLSIKPILSHSVLTVVLVIAAIALVSGFMFLWYDKDYSWIPFLIFFLLMVLVCVGWYLSHEAIDSGQPSPTIISDNNGNSVTTDAHTLRSKHAIEHIGQLFTTMGARKPLPEPDGLVSKDGSSQPNTKQKAVDIVNSINDRIQKQSQSFANETSLPSLEEAEAMQKTIDPIDEPYPNILEHNKTTIQQEDA